MNILNKVKPIFDKLRINLKITSQLQLETGRQNSFKFNSLSPRFINKGLIILLIILMGGVIFESLNQEFRVDMLIQDISKIQFQTIKERPIATFAPNAFYQKMVQQRDIFSPFLPAKKEKIVIKPKPVAPVKVTPPKIQITDLARDLSLVGISWGKNPQVMIHSNKDNVTYFVRKGQRIGQSDIRIKKIDKEKVVIKYEDQEMEL